MRPTARGRDASAKAVACQGVAARNAACGLSPASASRMRIRTARSTATPAAAATVMGHVHRDARARALCSRGSPTPATSHAAAQATIGATTPTSLLAVAAAASTPIASNRSLDGVVDAARGDSSTTSVRPTRATAHTSSEAPTILATASTCTGWIAKMQPAATAASGDHQRSASRATRAEATACQAMLTAWKTAGDPCEGIHSSAKRSVVSGRYRWPVVYQYGMRSANGIVAREWIV